ncbi:MAG: hypothetical protein UT50_C0001G0070 [Candidatus Moranbacteria bacterium GW2011_GWA2_39_41]|nr:MAG: hypothetical protein UT50_C0001G0070 [Candidatus Moranbacteria bacterium GW2011_GWA2_39_41]
MNNYFKKYWFVGLIVAILALGTFLRVYHFADWLHFELDQSRDAIVIDLAVEEGAANLPLLGPKAAGSFLRLGPIFYYFEYISAKIFGNTPAGIATVNLIFSILTLPLFYLFVRRYFERKISMALLAVFSTSLFLIMYSRFAWNPNNLPFFILLTFYALLQTVDPDEKRKGWWAAVASGAMAITTQLHFVAFLVVPMVTVVFLVIKRPRLRLIHWFAAVLIFVVLYIPPIVNDFGTGGANIKQFAKVFTKKSTKNDNSLFEKAVRNYKENSLSYLLLVSSYQKAELPKVNYKVVPAVLVCDEDCTKGTPMGILSIILFSAGIILLAYNLIKVWRQENSPQRDFIILICLWFGVSFVAFTPIAYDFAPRFFLLVAGLPFIFLGLMLQFFGQIIKNRRAALVALIVIVAIVLFSNLRETQARFSQLSRAPFENFKIKADRILKEQERVTMLQQEIITDYMEEFYKKNNFPIYLDSDPFYRRAFLYNLEQRQIPRDDMRNNKIYRDSNYFLIYPSGDNLDAELDDYTDKFEIIGQKEFGTLLVFNLVPKKEFITTDSQEFRPKGKPQSGPNVPVRFRWEEIFAEDSEEE